MPSPRYLVLVAVIAAAGAGGYFIGTRPRVADTPPVEEPKQQPAPTPRDLALEGVPRNGVFVATVKVPKVWDHAALKPLRDWLDEKPDRRQLVEPYFGLLPGELDRVSLFWHWDPTILAPWDEHALIPYALLSTKTPHDKLPVEKRLQARPESSPLLGRMTPIDSTCLFIGSPMEGYFRAIPPSVSRLMTPPPDGDIAPAIDEARNHAITIAVDIGRLSRNKPSPEDLPGSWGRAKPKFDYAAYPELWVASSAILTADLDDALAVQIVFHFADEPAAARAKSALEKLLVAIAGTLDKERDLAASEGEEGVAEASLWSWTAGVLRQAKVTAVGNTLKAEARIPFDDAFRNAIGGIPALLESELRLKPAMNNLKQIGLALHNFHDAHGTFPIEKLAMQREWSWRVQLLPYFEQHNLYSQLNTSLPWNHPANLKVLKEAKMPKVFEHPGRTAPPGQTYFRILTYPKGGKGGLTPIFREGYGARITDITDGSSNTILVVEAEKSVPWYELDILACDGSKPLPALGGKAARRFLALMADGTVRTISKRTPEKTLRALITPSGGEVIEQQR